MHPFPHHYSVTTSLRPNEGAHLRSEGLPELESRPPKEFDGPGDRWSPEGLFTAAIADCIILNFQGIAAMSKFPWNALEGTTHGVLDRADGKMRFTRFETHIKLAIPAGADPARAKMLLEKAEASCPLSNSLNCEKHLVVEIQSG